MHEYKDNVINTIQTDLCLGILEDKFDEMVEAFGGDDAVFLLPGTGKGSSSTMPLYMCSRIVNLLTVTVYVACHGDTV